MSTERRRWVVVGAGAVGGLVAGGLASAGEDVLLVARGAHGAALAAQGLEVRRPGATERFALPALAAVEALSPGPRDVVLLAVKGQDTEAAVRGLAAVSPGTTPVVCLQNGLENERIALRRFAHVVAANVMVPATHLEPGVVVGHAQRVAGIVDVGRFPAGAGAVEAELAAALEAAGFAARVLDDIVRWKRGKLLRNLANAASALCGSTPPATRLVARAREEGEAAFRAAGLPWAGEAEMAARRGDLLALGPVAGKHRSGSSTWQSLSRGAAIETDYLNGEVVLLGRLHGVSTPVNALLCRAMAEAAAAGTPPGATTERTLLAQLAPG